MTNHTLTPRAAKRRRISDDHHHHSLLPGLPDHIAHLCLSLISPISLYSVCRSWRRLIYSGNFPPFRSLYTLSLSDNQILRLSSFDPISSKWTTVDSPPPYLRRLSYRHPAFMSRSLPVQSVSVSGNLLLIAATSVHQNMPLPAFPRPIIFNPLSKSWSLCPPLSAPRRWCVAGALQETVVVASGIGSHYSETVARSVEKWVCRKNESFDKKEQDCVKSWGKIESLQHSMIRIESFGKKEQDSIENWEKIESFNNSRIKNQSFDENQHGKWENIGPLNNSSIKNESLEENQNGNREKIESLQNSTINSESFDENQHENWEKIESLDENKHGKWEKMQSLNTSPIKLESLSKIRYGKWEKMQSLKHSKLCREAIDAVGWKGKLCMVNVKGDFAKEGFIYNLKSDEWEAMPEGMLGGWRGPAAAMGEETMYVVDESRGVLKIYNEDSDSWSEIVADERLKGAEYMAAGGGRVCVVAGKVVGIVVVDVVAVPPRLWVVEMPAGDYDILSLHILPRMCSSETTTSLV